MTLATADAELYPVHPALLASGIDWNEALTDATGWPGPAASYLRLGDILSGHPPPTASRGRDSSMILAGGERGVYIVTTPSKTLVTWHLEPTSLAALEFVRPYEGTLSLYPDRWYAAPDSAPVLSEAAASDQGPGKALSESGTTDNQVVIAALREWMDVPVSGIADLAGVARRTVYNWIEDPNAGARTGFGQLRTVHGLLQPLTYEWSTAQVRAWLREGSRAPIQMLMEGRFSEFQRAVAAALTSDVVPLRRLQQVSGAEATTGIVAPLGAEELRLALVDFATPRPATPSGSAARPRELTDSVIE